MQYGKFLQYFHKIFVPTNAENSQTNRSPLIKIFLASVFKLSILAFLLIYMYFGANLYKGEIKNIPITPKIVRSNPSPEASAEPDPTPQSTENSNHETKSLKGTKLNTKNSSPLCKDIKEPWTLVPDPESEGSYIVCNSVKETMATAEEINTSLNNYRKSQSLSVLIIDQNLCQIASKRARETSVNFSHEGFEKAVEESNLNFSSVGENLASGPLSAVHFVEWSWDKSPGHRANMLGNWSHGCAGTFDRFAVYIFAG